MRKLYFYFCIFMVILCFAMIITCSIFYINEPSLNYIISTIVAIFGLVAFAAEACMNEDYER